MAGDSPARPEPDPVAVDPPLPVRLLGNRNFILLWLAYGISALGDHLSELAILKSLGALEREDTTALMARMSMCFMVPFFLLGPVTGWLADRLPRKWIMVTADAVRVLTMLNFAWLMTHAETLGAWGPFLPLLFVGVFAACFSPARSSLLPRLVREDQLVRANAFISGLGIIATMLGFYFGGLLAKNYAPQICFKVDSFTFLASGMILLTLMPPKRRGTRVGTTRGMQELLRGFGYVRTHKRVGQLILFAVVFWSVGATVRSTLPAIVTKAYGGDYQTIGTYQAAVGLGFVIGALILATLGDALRSPIAITWSLLGGGASAAITAATMMLPIEQKTAAALGLASCTLLGVFGTGVMTSCNALLQRIVPDRYRGRVFGVNDVATIAGLLLATGLLAIPEWMEIDRWVGHILLGAALLLLAAGMISLWVRLSRSPYGYLTSFLWNLNEFYTRWWFRLKREGICTVPAQGPVIVAANHTASIDPLLLVAACPHRLIGFMTAKEYYDLPLVKRLLRHVDCIPVDRDAIDLRSARAALDHLRKGKVLGIFPQGRIPEPGVALEPKDGAAMLALRSGATVVPAHISGTRWSSRVITPFLTRQRARVRFGKPIDLSPYRARPKSRETVHEVANLIMGRIRDLDGGTRAKTSRSQWRTAR